MAWWLVFRQPQPRISSATWDRIAVIAVMVLALTMRAPLVEYGLPYNAMWDEVVTYSRSLHLMAPQDTPSVDTIPGYGTTGYGDIPGRRSRPAPKWLCLPPAWDAIAGVAGLVVGLPCRLAFPHPGPTDIPVQGGWLHLAPRRIRSAPCREFGGLLPGLVLTVLGRSWPCDPSRFPGRSVHSLHQGPATCSCALRLRHRPSVLGLSRRCSSTRVTSSCSRRWLASLPATASRRAARWLRSKLPPSRTPLQRGVRQAVPALLLALLALGSLGQLQSTFRTVKRLTGFQPTQVQTAEFLDRDPAPRRSRGHPKGSALCRARPARSRHSLSTGGRRGVPCRPSRA